MTVDIVVTEAGNSPPFTTVDTEIALTEGLGGFIVLPGDSNNDSLVDIADPVWTINQMFRDGPASPCELAADSNGDRMVDLADAMYTINYEFSGGPPPPDGVECTLIALDAAGDLTCDDSACGD